MRLTRGSILGPTMMAAAALLGGSAAGCRDSSGPGATGSLIVYVDITCPAGSIEVTVDGQVLGTYPYTPGSTAHSFTVDAGQHVVSARETAGSGLAWQEMAIRVEADRTTTLNMHC